MDLIQNCTRNSQQAGFKLAEQKCTAIIRILKMKIKNYNQNYFSNWKYSKLELEEDKILRR